MSGIYRVLMEDQVDGKKFQFAIFVEGVNQTGSETLAQYGFTSQDGDRWDATQKALNEFPEAVFIDIKYAACKYFFS